MSTEQGLSLVGAWRFQAITASARSLNWLSSANGAGKCWVIHSTKEHVLSVVLVAMSTIIFPSLPMRWNVRR